VVRTFVLRLFGERRADGDVVGQVEDVATGETAMVRSADELVAFVDRSAGDEQIGCDHGEGG